MTSVKLQELLGMKLPRLRQHLVKLQCDITIIATDWFLCLFATVLPSEVSPEFAHRVACLQLSLSLALNRMLLPFATSNQLT